MAPQGFQDKVAFVWRVADKLRGTMDRFLDGNPIRSDGKLTVKSLAEEAAVKRWLLSHRHQDLLKENQRLRAELREAKATTAMLERLIAVEAFEARTTPRPGAPPGPPTLRPVT